MAGGEPQPCLSRDGVHRAEDGGAAVANEPIAGVEWLDEREIVGVEIPPRHPPQRAVGERGRCGLERRERRQPGEPLGRAAPPQQQAAARLPTQQLRALQRPGEGDALPGTVELDAPRSARDGARQHGVLAEARAEPRGRAAEADVARGEPRVRFDGGQRRAGAGPRAAVHGRPVGGRIGARESRVVGRGRDEPCRRAGREFGGERDARHRRPSLQAPASRHDGRDP